MALICFFWAFTPGAGLEHKPRRKEKALPKGLAGWGAVLLTATAPQIARKPQGGTGVLRCAQATPGAPRGILGSGALGPALAGDGTWLLGLGWVPWDTPWSPGNVPLLLTSEHTQAMRKNGGTGLDNC